mmetsp:Transcript_15999/g.46673  ORF Transcript_15999/g.46673 Transcript_15999/m.46673 type:complete len:200 (-) Transcript_15999:251-850(-)
MAASREVAESCLDLLAIEIVHHLIANEAAHEPAGAKFEAIGFSVGQRLAERLSTTRPPFTDTLDVMKFVCKEFWYELYRKQVDNLRTNHRGVYVLQDNRVRWLSRIAPPAGDRSASGSCDPSTIAPIYAHFPCGLIRGCLATFGIDAVVSAELSSQPACQFTIKIPLLPATAATTGQRAPSQVPPQAPPQGRIMQPSPQ